jgi:hypothetical protein
LLVRRVCVVVVDVVVVQMGVGWWSNLLQSLGDNASAVGDVGDCLAFHSGLQTELVRAGRLVALGQVRVFTPLINAHGAGAVGDVEEGEVVADPGVGLLAAGDKVHGVGGGEGEGLVVGLEQVRTLAHVDVLVGGSDTATLDWVFLGSLAGDEVVVGVVRDIEGSAGLVDLEQVDATAVGVDLDAHVVAANGAGPVGDAVGVDLATKNTDRGRELGVGSDRNAVVTLGGDGQSGSAGREGCNGSDGKVHVG